MRPFTTIGVSLAVGVAAMVTSCGGGGDAIDRAEDGSNAKPKVVINELRAGSSGWIELYNYGAASVDVSGWKVDDVANGGASPKSIGPAVILPPGGYLAVAFSGINASSLDAVRLVKASGVEVDSHSNFYGGSSIAGKCFGRVPNGGAWSSSSIPCTKGSSNGASGLLLRGTVVRPSGPIEGEVLVVGDTISCVAASCAGKPGASSAAIVDTMGIILPGLVDTHNHILFDIFDETDWSPPKIYDNHDQWPGDARYAAMVAAKQYLNGEQSPGDLGCEMDKYGELKGLVAGTTSIAGAANPANRKCYASLARTIDQTANGLESDKVQVAVLFPTKVKGDAACDNLASGETDSYLVHVGEGVDAKSLGELAKLATVTTEPGCLTVPETVIIHGTAFGSAEMDELADVGMSLVWSPRSNVFLYGGGTDLSKTTNIPLALAKGINVALAPDWSIGGSQNILDELRFANDVDDAEWGDTLTAKELFEMATIHAARALALDAVIGTIEVGKKADLVVISGDRTHPYDALLGATPKEVRMTMVGGVPLYGDVALAAYGPASPGCEEILVCGKKKFLCVAEAASNDKLDQTFAEIRAALGAGLEDYDDLDLSPYDFAPITPLVRCP
jgi:5-methylthioadenosine/S-adenosylhomocysteine deaminase